MGRQSKEVAELDNIHTLLTSLHWCPRKISFRRKITTHIGGHYLVAVD